MIARQPLVPLPHPLHALEGLDLVSVAFVPRASDPGLVAANDRGPMAVARLRIDDLSELVETHGAVCGSLAVRLVMRAIEAALPSCGSAVRSGRDEIEVVLPGSDLPRARRRIAAMLDVIHDEPIHVDGAIVHVTVSAGIAADRDPMGDESLQRRAAGALHEARHSGKGRVCLDLASA